jgi:hypothetical protein
MTNIIDRHKKQRTTQLVPVSSPYQTLYGLRENPFPAIALFTPASGDPRRNGSIYDKEFRADEERRFLELFIQPPTGDAPVPLGFVRVDPQAGLRGTGKSSFLNHIMHRINNADWENWPSRPEDPSLSALAVHVLPEPRRQKHFWQFVRLVFETLSERQLMGSIDVEFKAALLLQLVSEQQVDALSMVADMSERLASPTAFVGLLNELGISQSAFANAAEIAITAEGGATQNLFVRDFLKANCDLVALWTEWRRISLATSDYQWRVHGSEWLVDGLVPILAVAGYVRFIIILDEFEKIYLQQTAREREAFLDELRQCFYERDSVAVRKGCITTVLTTHPSIDRYLKDVWSRVGLDNLAPLSPDRMPYISVELGKSNLANLRTLLAQYLDQYRLAEVPRGSIYPFATDALDPAMETASFYPRGTLWYAHAILRKAAAEGIQPPISRAFVDEFLQSGQRPPTAAEDESFILPDFDIELK